MAQESEESFKVTDRRRRSDPGASPPPGPAEPQARRREEGERSLHGLFMLLATEVVIALGEEADPVSGQRRRDLQHAAESIDLLLLLREKTEGNRTAAESSLLADLLYDLQLRYVRAAKPPG
jgi:hypothetical protein